jgi:hypothetical protein
VWGGRVSGRTAATHCDAGTAKLIADRSGRDAQLRTDLAQGPTLGVQVGCMFNVHRDTVTSLSRVARLLPVRREGANQRRRRNRS